ncbi:MAG: Rieske 2Fe-2S domain-containing protein [Chloroflexi bacterium]|nr:Rieske 2Fe-2S domain-containing protein [Chloroflexota bacterium]
MLSVEDNELITQTGPGTPMGNLMRQYWVPCMLSAELPAPDCDPVRVLILSEKLIGFRDSDGKVGLIQNHCPHRGASLFFGRNEQSGLRCVYHGWKFDVSGQCVDMPNEPAESNFKNKVKALAYPCVERGGVVWTYMGPRATPPPLPDIEGNMIEGAQAGAEQQECNWLQIAEGSIDTSHAAFLHWGSLKPEDEPEGTFSHYVLKDKQPRYSVLNTDAGVMYGAYRPAQPGMTHWRIAQFVLPFFTMNPQGLLGGGPMGMNARVPMDDTHTLSISVGTHAPGQNPGRAHPVSENTTDWYGRFRMKASLADDFFIDRELQRSNKGRNGFSGISGGFQDQAITTSMGMVYDRSQEHLGTSDSMIIQTRKRLLQAARAFAETGIAPPGVDNPEYYRVRSGNVFLPDGVDWVEATKDLRRAFVEHPNLDRSGAGGVSGGA